jgi:hypothetical protein
MAETDSGIENRLVFKLLNRSSLYSLVKKPAHIGNAV